MIVTELYGGFAMFRCVGNDGAVTFETVRQLIFSVFELIDFLYAVLQKVRKTPLQQHKISRRSINLARATPAFQNREGAIFSL